MEKIYLDHAATTYVDDEVLQAMIPCFKDVYGNGSSQHFLGREALALIDESREKIARCLNCKASEIYFVSGGTEADNMAIKGYCLAHEDKGKHIITTKIEHPAVIQACKKLEKYGYEVTYLDVDNEGFVSAQQVEDAIREDTVLVTIMMANNEVGTIEPIAEIGKVCKAHNIAFHTDAVQAAGNLVIDVKELNVDMLSISAHKFYGPKGVGVLYKKNGLKIQRFLDGGEQERNLRASTLNTPGIVGMGIALEKACRDMEKNNEHIAQIRDYFVEKVQKLIPHILYNGAKDNTKRLSSNASFSFVGVEGEGILFHLDLANIAVSSGSACSSGSLDPSHVLLSIGVPIEIAHGSIRFSFGKANTIEQADYVVEKLVAAIKRLREISPVYLELIGGKENV